MYDSKIDTRSLPWVSLDFAGVSMKTLFQDPQTGGMTVLTQLQPGASIPAHSHTHANETVFVVEGDLIEDGVSYAPGSFFIGTAGTRHGPHTTTGGCKLLTTFSATLDFVLAK